MTAFVVVTVGFFISAALTFVAVREGRRAPVHRVLWIIALVVLSIDVAYHVVVSIAAIATGGWETTWLAIGTLAIAGVLASAVFQPSWAGWWFIASAALMPAVLVVSDLILQPSEDSQIPLIIMLTFYSTRAVIVGLLLVFSCRVSQSSLEKETVQSRSL